MIRVRQKYTLQRRMQMARATSGDTLFRRLENSCKRWLFRYSDATTIAWTSDSLLRKWWWFLTDQSYRRLYYFVKQEGTVADPPCFIMADLALGLCASYGGIDCFRIDPVHANAIVNVRNHSYTWLAAESRAALDKKIQNDATLFLYSSFQGEGISWQELSPYLKGQRLQFLTDPNQTIRRLGQML